MRRALGMSCLLMTMLVTVLVPMLSGCQVIGIAADRLAGPLPVEAKYSPGEFTPVLVLVENYRDSSPVASDAPRVARMVGQVLSQKKAATVIDQEKLLLLKDSKPGTYQRMSVVDIGKAVGAQQVIYVDLGGVAVGAQQASEMIKGRAAASVKVIDVTTGEVRFPVDRDGGQLIEFTSPLRRGEDSVNPESIRGETLIGLSTQIARLFYKYQPGDLEALDTGL